MFCTPSTAVLPLVSTLRLNLLITVSQCPVPRKLDITCCDNEPAVLGELSTCLLPRNPSISDLGGSAKYYPPHHDRRYDL